MSERVEGWYHVKVGEYWTHAYWFGKAWNIIGEQGLSDEYFDKVGSRIPAPDELITENQALSAHAKKDAERIDWLEQQARKSRTGISFDWVPSCEGDPSGFRFMRRHFIGEQAKTLRQAIDKVMGADNE